MRILLPVEFSALDQGTRASRQDSSGRLAVHKPSTLLTGSSSHFRGAGVKAITSEMLRKSVCCKLVQDFSLKFAG